MKQEFSIWSSFDVDLSPEEMVLALEARGMHLCELSDEHAVMLLNREGTPAQIGQAFRAFAAAHNVSFPQGHLWLSVRLCDASTDVIQILSRWIELFSAIGIRNAVLHCDAHSFPENTSQETIWEANAAVLRKLAPIAEGHHVRLCLENLRYVFNTAQSLLEVIHRVSSPALGICLDTGHLNITQGETQAHFIHTAGNYLHALHIADNEGKTDQHMMPFGRGTVDFSEVMQALKEIGYQDLFNYEIPGERNVPMVLRAAKTVYLRAVTDYLFSL